jgi:hypothetical protein
MDWDVRNLRDERSHVTDAGHETRYHGPSQIRAVYCRGLMHNWADAMGFYDTPYEESDTSRWSHDGFQSEQVTTGTS